MKWFEKEECKKYLHGLTYLASKGFELTLKEDGKILNSKDHHKEIQSILGGPQGPLPKPYKSEWSTLSKDFMEHYKIETIVDIAKLMRIVSIILTNCTGEKDLFNNHHKRLIKFFDYQFGFNPSIVMDALIAYDEVYSTRKSFPKSEYIDFAVTLDYLFYLFKPEDSLHDHDFIY
ncbi:MAG: hypothetical protein FK733_17595 [Asgard group archaeon]|nr:hypothetical protein [Asgard group archaeon]